MLEMNPLIATLAAERGVTPEALRKWRERGRVPHRERFPLAELAKSKELSLSEHDFEFPPEAGKGRAV